MKHLARSFPFVMVLCFVLLLSACTTKAKQTGPTKIRLVEVTHSLFYAPQYVALSQGFFKKEGLELDLSNGNGGDKTMTTLVANQSEIVLVGAEAAIYVTARSPLHPIVAFAQLTQTDGSFLVSRTPIPNFDWKMLKGKTLLGQRRGGMPEMISEYVQRKHGLIPHQDVQIIQNIDYQNLGNAFVAGTGDYVQLFEPVASKIEKEGKGYIVASFGKDSGHVPYTCYLTKKSFLEQNPDVIKRFVRAIQKGQDWVATHSPEEIATAIRNEFPDTDRDILIRVIKRYKDQHAYATNTIIDEEEYQRLLDVMNQSGELPSKIPYEKLVNNTFSKEVLQEGKKHP
jgi:NitT/TauT family transport system substrate-binding protein